MNYSPPGSSVHGILQARILEWVAVPFSRGSSQPRDQTLVSCIAGRFLLSEPPVPLMKALIPIMRAPSLLPIFLQRLHLLIPAHWRLSFNIWILSVDRVWVDTHISSLAIVLYVKWFAGILSLSVCVCVCVCETQSYLTLCNPRTVAL